MIDVKKAYNNIRLKKTSQKYTTITTPIGLFVWLRVPYGVASSGAIFQRLMDKVLKDLEDVCCRIDDILMGAATWGEMLILLNEVVCRLEKAGFSCSLEKSVFMSDKLVYLGHEVSAEGIRPVQKKINAWLEAPEPKDVSELVSFLGAVNYYRKYLPDLATVINPLENLRKKGVKWTWGKEERKSYEMLRKMLASKRVLMFYNDGLPLILETDASGVGLGAVMSHRCVNGDVRPVEYISKTLTKSEKNYSQIEKEALSIIWAVKRLYLYLYGRQFELVTDHKPLTTILNEHQGMPQMAACRIARWRVSLMEFDYKIRYRSTKEHANCDALSRLPMRDDGEKLDQVNQLKHSIVQKQGKYSQEEMELEVNSVAEWDNYLNDTFLNVKVVERELKKDKIMQQVMDYQINGWPNQVPESLQPYYRKRDELSVQGGCLTWGVRTVIPTVLRAQVLQLLHLTHAGMVSMKRLARAYVWWPNIDLDIEETVRICRDCGEVSKMLPKVVIHPWVRPSGPFQRVHVDFTGPFMGKSWLVLVCAYSKWVEVVPMMSTTSSAVIKEMRAIFSRTGIPNCVVSDNATNFCSVEMEEFFRNNGIKHVNIATYSSASNGIVERFNQTLKISLKRMAGNKKSLEHNLASILLFYRNIPHPSTDQTPSRLMYGRALRTQLSCLKAGDEQVMRQLDKDVERQEKIEKGRHREYQAGQKVWVKLATGDVKFEEGTILEKQGEVMYKVRVRGREVLKHVNMMKDRKVSEEEVLRKERVEEAVPVRETLPEVDMRERAVPEVKVKERDIQPVVSINEHVTGERVTVSEKPVRRKHGEKWAYLSESGVRRSSRARPVSGTNQEVVNVDCDVSRV